MTSLLFTASKGWYFLCVCTKLYPQLPLDTGPVKVGLMVYLPVKGISLLVGNDLNDDWVVPSIQITSEPVADETLLAAHVFPSCAVTRAVAQKAQEGDHVKDFTFEYHDQPSETGQDTSDTYINLSDSFRISASNTDSSGTTDSNSTSGDLSLSREQLITEQIHDADLAHLRDRALTSSEIQDVPT